MNHRHSKTVLQSVRHFHLASRLQHNCFLKINTCIYTVCMCLVTKDSFCLAVLQLRHRGRQTERSCNSIKGSRALLCVLLQFRYCDINLDKHIHSYTILYTLVTSLSLRQKQCTECLIENK